MSNWLLVLLFFKYRPNSRYLTPEHDFRSTSELDSWWSALADWHQWRLCSMNSDLVLFLEVYSSLIIVCMPQTGMMLFFFCVAACSFIRNQVSFRAERRVMANFAHSSPFSPLVLCTRCFYSGIPETRFRCSLECSAADHFSAVLLVCLIRRRVGVSTHFVSSYLHVCMSVVFS